MCAPCNASDAEIRRVPGTVLGAGITERSFLPTGLALALEAFSDKALRERGKSIEAAWGPSWPPASCSHLERTGTAMADGFQVGFSGWI